MRLKGYIRMIDTELLKPFQLTYTAFKPELEGKDYLACRFKLGPYNIIFRQAKITPKKIGQFVTFWKRHAQSLETEPFDYHDDFDAYMIGAHGAGQAGLFVLPKSVLLERGIISKGTKDGKRGFRVYPAWDKPLSKQACASQEWQLAYFFEPFSKENTLARTLSLFHKKSKLV